MIIIKMHEEKWRIILGNEIWQFGTINEFKVTLDTLINMKETFGKLNNNQSKL